MFFNFVTRPYSILLVALTSSPLLRAQSINTSSLAFPDVTATSAPFQARSSTSVVMTSVPLPSGSPTLPSTPVSVATRTSITPSATDTFDFSSLSMDIGPTLTLSSVPVSSSDLLSPTSSVTPQDESESLSTIAPSLPSLAPTAVTPTATPMGTPTTGGGPPTIAPITVTPVVTDSSDDDDDDDGGKGSQLPLAAVVGIAIGATITAVSLSLTVALLICFCCCCVQSKKYEYNTGNEHRMTVQQWNITSAHFNMNRVDSMSSVGSSHSSRSRASSLFGSFGFTRRYSNSADHVTSIINQSVPDLYSTPV